MLGSVTTSPPLIVMCGLRSVGRKGAGGGPVLLSKHPSQARPITAHRGMTKPGARHRCQA